jgi:uncharacterized protein (DUF885 family)
MKKLFISTVVLLVSCVQTTEDPSQGLNEDHRFQAYANRFIEALWRQEPTWASSVGFHKYDSILIVPDATSRSKNLSFAKANLDSLGGFNFDSLSPSNKTDYQLLQNYFRKIEWSINNFRAHEWMPSHYNVCETFAEMLANNYDTIDKRLHNFYNRMAYVPAYYLAAKRNIKQPTAEHTELAISQNTGGLQVFQSDLEEALLQSGLTAEDKQKIKVRADSCVTAIQSYVTWLRDSAAVKTRSFRIGKTLYNEKFNFDIQSGYNAEQMYHKALDRKVQLHQQMFAITKELWPKYFKTSTMPSDSLIAIKRIIDKISLTHAHRDSFQTTIEKQIPELEKFVNEKQLIYLDPSKPLVVRKEPAYMAGFAGASISAPGPYETNGNTYYNVGSLSGWDKDRAESYLREYNQYVLQILNIHEAIPGHYTQLVYSNKNPGLVKSIFRSGAMVEGWAVYSELMMLENGYGALPGKSIAEPELWLMYFKWNLRSVCNTILDYGIHINNIDKAAGLDLLINQAFQQKAEAEGKWKRATLSQVQLCSYFTGFIEIYDLRETMKQKLAHKFDLKNFHEQFLSYGSAPVEYIRALMMN